MLEAARIVTGLPVFTKSDIVYKEVGCEKLEARRQRRKLQMFYTMQNNLAPDYFCELIPPSIQSTTIYPLRNGEDLIVPFCRLSLTSGSFIPSTIRKWNSLDQTVRNVDSISKFKTNLKNSSGHIKSVPVYFSYGPRKLNITLTQIRCSASFLNEDLFKVNIVNSPSCNNCGASLENARHFFLECPTYADIRTVLFDKLSFLPVIDHHLLTSGIAELSTAQNETIFKHVFDYIKRSKRFLLV